MYKIAFFDVDGTLLQFGEKKLSPKTTYALQQIQKQGVLLCMLSGRSNGLVPHFQGISFDIVATFNGSYIRYKDKVISTTPMLKSDIFCIIDNLKKMDRAYTLCNKDIFITSGNDYALEKYFSFGSARPNIVDNIEDYYDDDIFQMMCACTEDEYETILAGTTSTKIEAWWDQAADIIPKQSGKGFAVKTILNHFEIDSKAALAFGDGDNDTSMLKAVGTGVAMGNAKERVKQYSDFICKSVDEDGVYCCLQDLFKFKSF